MKEKLLVAGCIAILVGSLILVPAQGKDPVEKLSVAKEIAIRNVGEEIKSLRRGNTEVYKAGKDEFKARIYSKPKYYYDSAGDSLALPDLSIHEISALEKLNPLRSHDKYVDAGIYKVTWFDDKPWDYTFYTQSGAAVKLTALFNMTDITIETIKKTQGTKQNIIIERTRATTRLSWLVESNIERSFINEKLIFSDKGKFAFRITKPTAFDADRMTVPVMQSISGDTLTYDIDIGGAKLPITVDPSILVTDLDNTTGRLLNNNKATWALSRDATTGNVDTGNIITSSVYAGSQYYLSRGLIRFDTSSLPDNANIDSVKAVFVIKTTTPTGSDSVWCCQAAAGLNQSSFAADNWNDFVGWAASGAYSVTKLGHGIDKDDYSHTVPDTIRFTWNESGKAIIEKADTTQFFLLSERDITDTQPTTDDGSLYLEDDSPYLEIWYKAPTPPANFTMTALGPHTIACAWEDSSDNEEKFCIINISDMSVVDSTAANAEADTINGLSENTKYVWKVAADSAGVRGYSDPDSVYTLLNPPTILDITIMPISSDTLRISVTEPPNGTADSTGMDVYAVSGSGATSSGWLTGEYSYLDGGLNPDSVYVYKIRLKNGDGDSTGWSPKITYSMKGLDTFVVNLAGDLYDDYNVDFGNGQRDSTVIRVGASDSGERLDGFVSFTLPWSVVNGGVDSLFLTMTRAEEKSSGTPAISVYGIPSRHDDTIEECLLGLQDSTNAAVSWTVESGTGARTSPELRKIFREWQDFSNYKYFSYDFGFRLDDSSQADSVRAVFLDYSHPSYSNGTSLTIYYTPGYPDSVEYAPGDFSLTVLAPDSINASWSDNSSGEYGFVLLNLSDSTKVAGTDSLDRNTTGVDVSGLTPNTVYDWFVRAYSTYNDSSSSSESKHTFARIPGNTTVSALSDTTLHFIINPVDNPSWTTFTVQDSITGYYVDCNAEPDTLRPGPPGDWGWKTFYQWGSASGDTLEGLNPDSLYVLRAKAKSLD